MAGPSEDIPEEDEKPAGPMFDASEEELEAYRNKPLFGAGAAESDERPASSEGNSAVVKLVGSEASASDSDQEDIDEDFEIFELVDEPGPHDFHVIVPPPETETVRAMPTEEPHAERGSEIRTEGGRDVNLRGRHMPRETVPHPARSAETLPATYSFEDAKKALGIKSTLAYVRWLSANPESIIWPAGTSDDIKSKLDLNEILNIVDKIFVKGGKVRKMKEINEQRKSVRRGANSVSSEIEESARAKQLRGAMDWTKSMIGNILRM